jgi:geranylgeranyl diphosphate synthase type I
MMFEEKITEIENELKKVLKERAPQSMYDVCAHLLLAGGKRLRPLLAMLSCGAFSDYRKALPYGISLEFLHNFTLLHDDLMDKDVIRRGIKTAHVVYGEPLAILAGDTLHSMAFEHMADNYDGPTTKLLTKETAHMTLEICHGQSFDIAYEKREPSEEEYLEMIYKKTAIFFEKAAFCGAIIGGADESSARKLGEMGRYMGMGFQLWDDLLSIVGKEEKTGKRAGNDIVRGKKTLIILRAKKHGVKIKILGKEDANDEELEDAIEALKDCGAVDEVKEIAENYFSEAKSRALSRELVEYIDMVKERER